MGIISLSLSGGTPGWGASGGARLCQWQSRSVKSRCSHCPVWSLGARGCVCIRFITLSLLLVSLRRVTDGTVLLRGNQPRESSRMLILKTSKFRAWPPRRCPGHGRNGECLMQHCLWAKTCYSSPVCSAWCFQISFQSRDPSNIKVLSFLQNCLMIIKIESLLDGHLETWSGWATLTEKWHAFRL